MSSAAIVGFDIGTTSVKAAAFDSTSGEILSEIQIPHLTHSPKAEWSEQEPRDWMLGVAKAWEVVSADVVRDVSAIGIVSQVNTHVFVDKDLEPVMPAIVWNDLRSVQVAEAMDGHLGDRERSRMFGGPFKIDASFAGSRWNWLKEANPQMAERVTWILSPKDFCIAHLTGTVGTDAISSIGLVGAEGTYIENLDALAEGIFSRLPPLRRFDEAAGVTSGSWEFEPGLPIAVGTMDAWANVYGSGVTEAGQGLEVSGTSEIVGVMSDGPGSAQGVISFPPVRGRYLHVGPTQAGGQALHWVAQMFSMSIPEALAAASRAEDGRLIFLPHLQGERAPVWNSKARGVWVGLTNDSGAGEMIKAVLEGVAFSARWIREVCEQAAALKVQSLRLSGGGSKSQFWNQIKASAHALPMEILSCAASGCLGAALMGAAAGGLTGEDIEGWAARLVFVENIVEPAAGAQRLDELYSIYRATYAGMQEVFELMAGEIS